MSFEIRPRSPPCSQIPTSSPPKAASWWESGKGSQNLAPARQAGREPRLRKDERYNEPRWDEVLTDWGWNLRRYLARKFQLIDFSFDEPVDVFFEIDFSVAADVGSGGVDQHL